MTLGDIFPELLRKSRKDGAFGAVFTTTLDIIDDIKNFVVGDGSDILKIHDR